MAQQYMNGMSLLAVISGVLLFLVCGALWWCCVWVEGCAGHGGGSVRGNGAAAHERGECVWFVFSGVRCCVLACGAVVVVLSG
jgi:hypothetical protein